MANLAEASPARGRRPGARRNRVQRLEIAVRKDLLDPAGLEARANLREAGLGDVRAVRVLRTWFLQGDLDSHAVGRAAAEVLADPVQDVYRVGGDAPLTGRGARPRLVTVIRKPGVTNPEAESARLALETVGLPVAQAVVSRTTSSPMSSQRFDTGGG